MYNQKITSPNLINNFLPAVLKHTKHGWTVEYSVRNPYSGLMDRRVIKMNRIRKRYARLGDFKAHCLTVILKLNNQLASGWTPFTEVASDSRQMTPLSFVLDDYISDKSAELRSDTIINYKSFTKVFGAWVDAEFGPIAISSFSRIMAVRFMDYISREKGLRGRSYNNRLKQARAFFSYAMEKFYCNENPFAAIKTKREDAKKRILIPADVRKRIFGYWLENNENYLALCELVFSALVRPKECWRLQVKDLHLADGFIEISENESKTHYRRSPSLTNELALRLSKMVDRAKPTDYVFGEGYKPGKKQICYSRFRKDWQTMRAALGLPDEMQLYSLRDTGINEMIHGGIDVLSVMQHADHHDLSMTTKYANHANPHLKETIQKKAPKF